MLLLFVSLLIKVKSLANQIKYIDSSVYCIILEHPNLGFCSLKCEVNSFVIRKHELKIFSQLAASRKLAWHDSTFFCNDNLLPTDHDVVTSLGWQMGLREDDYPQGFFKSTRLIKKLLYLYHLQCKVIF